jgi:hypothetical protein
MMQTMVDKKLSPEEFDIAVRRTRMSDTSRDAGRAVLVDGHRQRDVAPVYGITPARLSAIVSRVSKEVDLLRSQSHTQLKVLEADYALATNLSRQRLGNSVQILQPEAKGKYLGEMVGCTTFYAVQDIGRGQVVVHDLSKLNVVPELGKKVAIEYVEGAGRVVTSDRGKPGRAR